MKFATVKIAGKEYDLFYNGAAMFALKEINNGNIIEILNQDTPESYDFICRAVAVLSEQAELARRYLGYDKKPIITYEEIKKSTVSWTMLSYIKTKTAIVEAMNISLKQEVEPEEGEEIDEGLAELSKKKTKKPRKPTT